MPRIIYSLHFDLEDPRKPSRLVGLVAPLDATGNSPHCRPNSPVGRLIDLRAGQQLRHLPSQRVYRIKTIRAYREAFARSATTQRGGYIVRGT